MDVLDRISLGFINSLVESDKVDFKGESKFKMNEYGKGIIFKLSARNPLALANG